MKKQMLYLTILVFPFVVMIIVNEFVRLNKKEKGYQIQGVTAMNSATASKKQCSWICHNNTDFCKKNHVKLAKPYFKQLDPIYFGIIDSFGSTGHYGLANIFFLVILIPLLMYFLLVKSISIEYKIRGSL